MEITEVQKAASLGKIHKKEALVSATKVEDSLNISNEVEKRMLWLDKLKEMPDVRMEKLTKTYSYESGLNRVVAERIIHPEQT